MHLQQHLPEIDDNKVTLFQFQKLDTDFGKPMLVKTAGIVTSSLREINTWFGLLKKKVNFGYSLNVIEALKS